MKMASCTFGDRLSMETHQLEAVAIKDKIYPIWFYIKLPKSIDKKSARRGQVSGEAFVFQAR